MLKLILLQQLPKRYFHEKNERCLERRLILKIHELLTTSFHGLSIPNPEYSGIFHHSKHFLFVYLCLVRLHGAKYFVPVQIFCVGPKIYLHIVPVTTILCQTRRWFECSKIAFFACTKVFEEALNAVKFLSWLKKFGPAQTFCDP